MNIETAHTPGPWRFDDRGSVAVKLPDQFSAAFTDEAFLVYADSPAQDGKTVAVCPGDGAEDAANAAFIVRACNSHDALLAACNTAMEYIGDDGGECPLCGGNGQSLPYHRHCVCKPIRAAIASAKPESR